jgi:hypothetical protein
MRKKRVRGARVTLKSLDRPDLISGSRDTLLIPLIPAIGT